MKKEYPKRKPNRLSEFDYRFPGAYFITICTDNRRNYFWIRSNADILCPKNAPLSEYGKIVDDAIQMIPIRYSSVTVVNYAIMPNHVHLLLQLSANQDGRPLVAPTISTIIQQFKGVVSKHAGFPIWQKGFYDHIVRNDTDYREIWMYIENNPAKWSEDQLYSAYA